MIMPMSIVCSLDLRAYRPSLGCAGTFILQGDAFLADPVRNLSSVPSVGRTITSVHMADITIQLNIRIFIPIISQTVKP